MALTASLALGACGVGAEEGGEGARAINWYAFNEPGGSYQMAVDNCNEQANGEYTINYVKLPNIADQQRELLVRRLAAEDDDIDLASLDVIWTAEFAQAEWILPWEGERRSAAEEGKLEGPLETARFEDQIWAIPHTSNTQLLWYRKDRVDPPPEDFTWDEMIDQAVENGTSVEVQAAQYEGLVVWINALIAGAGGQVVDEQGEAAVDESARRAAEIESKLANSPAAPPGMSTNREDQGRQGFESGRSDYQVNYTFIYPSAEATECLASPENQALSAELGGLPPTTESVYDDPKVQEAFPFADALRESIDNAAPRPVTPAYSDISLAIQKTFHPPDGVDPGGIVEQLGDRVDKAVEGKIF